MADGTAAKNYAAMTAAELAIEYRDARFSRDGNKLKITALLRANYNDEAKLAEFFAIEADARGANASAKCGDLATALKAAAPVVGKGEVRKAKTFAMRIEKNPRDGSKKIRASVVPFTPKAKDERATQFKALSGMYQDSIENGTATGSEEFYRALQVLVRSLAPFDWSKNAQGDANGMLDALASDLNEDMNETPGE